MKNRNVYLLGLSVLIAGNMYGQALPETKSYESADRTIRVANGEKVELRVGEVVDVYCDSDDIVNSFWESSMSACWVDHAWVFHSGGKGNDHPNNRYITLSHIDSSIGLTRIYALEPTDGFISMEMYYSLSWRYPGSRIYVLQDEYYFKLKVYAIHPKSVSLSEETVRLSEGKSVVLTPSLTPSDAYTKYTWSSDNEEVATVDEDGEVYAEGEGSAMITVTTGNGLTASCEVRVLPAPDQVSLPAEVRLYVGYGYQMSPELYPKESAADLRWKSSDKKVASVNTSGYVSAKATGETEITVTTDNGVSAASSIKVEDAPEGMKASEAQSRLSIIQKLVNRTL